MQNKQANGSGQRLLRSLHPTKAASVNPLHPNCYTARLYSRPNADKTISNNSLALFVHPIAP
jgi:hypothetical protein